MKKFTDKINESFEDKIPTAGELFQKYNGFEADHSSRDILDMMIEFAKLHVEKALLEADRKAEYEFSEEAWSYIDDKEFIVKSYPLDNIK